MWALAVTIGVAPPVHGMPPSPPGAAPIPATMSPAISPAVVPSLDDDGRWSMLTEPGLARAGAVTGEVRGHDVRVARFG